jgi:hypothetical protein
VSASLLFLTFSLSAATLDVKKLEPAEPALARRSYLERLDQVFPATVRRVNLEVMAWTVEVEHSFASSARHGGDPVPLLEMRGSLLLRGLVYANKVWFVFVFSSFCWHCLC